MSTTEINNTENNIENISENNTELNSIDNAENDTADNAESNGVNNTENSAKTDKANDNNEKAETMKAASKPDKQKVIDFCNKFALIIQFAGCFILYFIIEALCRHSVAAAFVYLDLHTKAFFYNVMLIYMTFMIPYLFRRRVFARCVIGTIWMILGIVNSVLLLNRVTPLTGSDLKSFKEAAAIVTKYLSIAELILFGILFAAVVAAIVYVFRKAPKFGKKVKYQIVAPGIVVAGLLFWGLTSFCLNHRILTLYFDNIAYCYQDYGFPYCFTVTALDTGIDQPEQYSEATVRGILSQTGTVGQTDLSKYGKPNIIVVQLETFFDVSRLSHIEFSEDPIPNWHRLTEEYSSGYLTVPVVGAGTANTEFEVLTGMSMRYFGAGETPFKGVLKERTCDSAAFALKELGYRTNALHDNEANFYSRRVVYSRLGFDTFTSEEYMDTQDDVNYNGWMKDINLVRYINDALDVTPDDTDYVFTVSVQPHGAYPTEAVLDDPEITVTGAEDEETGYAWEYYINEIHEEDAFVDALIREVDKRGEPTVILFYGDHLPTMNLSNADLKSGDIYQTDYLMWDNIGLKQKDKDLAAYTLTAELFNRLNIHKGVMFRFHQSMQKNPEYMNDLQMLQYDIIYGKKYVHKGQEPLKKTNIKLGCKNIFASGVERVGDDAYFIYGKNFTQSSKVSVDEELMDTVYIDSSTLLFKSEKIPTCCEIAVVQQSNSSTHKILSYSNKIITYNIEQSNADFDVLFDDSVETDEEAE